MMGNRFRPATALDILFLGVAPAVRLQLDLVQQLLFPHHPVQAAIAGWLPWGEPSYLFVCDGGAGLLACVQAAALSGISGWGVRYLAVWRDGLDTTHALWKQLLLGLGEEAGRRSVLRLLAFLPTEEHLTPFQEAGFHPYAEEILLRWGAEDGESLRPMPVLRPMQSADLWAVHQLYQALTPPRVQQMEGRTSDSWRVGRGEEAWVWEEEQVRAYLRRRRGLRGTVLDLLLDPVCRREAQAVLAHGLVGARPPVYLVLRSYQGELLEVARRLGFRPFAEQVLLGKPLAVPAVQRHSAVLPGEKRQFGAAPTAPIAGRAWAGPEAEEI
ncbi:MAG: hypothetical protein ACP5SI_08325 [Chloroflexia bacterium]